MIDYKTSPSHSVNGEVDPESLLDVAAIAFVQSSSLSQKMAGLPCILPFKKRINPLYQVLDIVQLNPPSITTETCVGLDEHSADIPQNAVNQEGSKNKVFIRIC